MVATLDLDRGGGADTHGYHGPVFLGDDLLPLLVLALGAAMVFGNAAALIRPPEVKVKETDLTDAPRTRSLMMIGIGALAAVWALATLLTV